MSSNSSDAGDEAVGFQGRALTASLTVRDLAASLAWYVDVVGFAVTKRHERGGTYFAASIKGGEIELLLSQDNGEKGWERAKGEGIGLMLTTSQSIDALAQRLRDHGWSLASEPTDMPWGARTFRVVDPDGFKLVFSTPR